MLLPLQPLRHAAPEENVLTPIYTLGSWLRVEVTETKIKHKPSINLKNNEFQVVL